MRIKILASRASQAGMLLVLLLLLVSCAVSNSSNESGELPLPNQGAARVDYSPEPSQWWQLKNGLRVVFNPNREVPLVGGTLFIPGGALFESKEKLSQYGAMGSLMQDGGAGDLTADQLDRKLDLLSASISSGFGAENGTISFAALSPDLDTVFKLFAAVVRSPRFEESRLELWRGQALEGIKRRKDDPNTIADISLSKLVYGEHRLGQASSSKDIQAISRDDLVSLHREVVRPDQAILALSGDLSREQAEALVERYFGDWPSSGVKSAPLPPVSANLSHGIYFVEAPLSQATVIVGQQGAVRLGPDMIEIELFNTIFGGGNFGSRLMRRIRTELGLAYGAYGFIGQGPVEGRNVISLATKSGSAGDALEESLKVLNEMQHSPVTEQELAEAKAATINSFLFRFDSPEKVASREAVQRLLGYPADYDARYVERVEAVTPEDIERVAREYWRFNELVVVVVGNKAALDSVERARTKSNSLLAGWPLKRVKFDEVLIYE